MWCNPVPQTRVQSWQPRGQNCGQAIWVEGMDALFNQIISSMIFPALQKPLTVQSRIAVLGRQSYHGIRAGCFSMNGFKKLFELLGTILLRKIFHTPAMFPTQSQGLSTQRAILESSQ